MQGEIVCDVCSPLPRSLSFRYGLLKMCWEEDPELRPSFGQLVNVFSTLLESAQVKSVRPER